MLVKLKNIATVVSGATPTTKHQEYFDGDIYWITPKDLANNTGSKYIRSCERKISKAGYDSCSTCMIPPYNILITTRAPIGYIAINTMPCCTNQGFKSLICTPEKVDVDFLFYYLKHKMSDIEKLGSGTTFKEVSKSSIENFEVDLPDLITQRKIAKILAELDAQIDRNFGMVKKLQVLSQAIFCRMFADEKREVSLVDFPYSTVLKPGIRRFDGTKHYVATAEVEGDRINFDAPLIDFDTRENRANMQPVVNSVWFAKLKNSVKHIYISECDKELIENYIFSTGFCGIKCDKIAFEYLINFLNLPFFEKEKDILSHGATMEGVNNEDLKSIKIHLPEKDKLLAFHNKTSGIHKFISQLNQITFNLTKLKSKLLPYKEVRFDTILWFCFKPFFLCLQICTKVIGAISHQFLVRMQHFLAYFFS